MLLPLLERRTPKPRKNGGTITNHGQNLQKDWTRLENAKVQEEIAKEKSNQIISDLKKKLNELEDLKKEDERKMILEQQQNERLKNVLDQNNSDLKNGQEMIDQLE